MQMNWPPAEGDRDAGTEGCLHILANIQGMFFNQHIKNIARLQFFDSLPPQFPPGFHLALLQSTSFAIAIRAHSLARFVSIYLIAF